MLAHSFRDFSLSLWGGPYGTEVYVITAGLSQTTGNSQVEVERQPPFLVHT